MPDPISIVTFDRKYLPDFIALNREWIEKHFCMETMDLKQLEDAESVIIDKGGEIFFVLKGQEVVGTCAMVPHGNDFELAKMAVSPKARGNGIGDMLMLTAIDWAKKKGLPKITLLSNTVLEPAITLYKKHGFKEVPINDHCGYSRCNIEMELILK